MINVTLDDGFVAALRRELIAEARKSKPTRRRTFAAAVAGVLAVGAGVFAVGAANGGPDADLPLSAPIIETHVGTATVALPAAPPDAQWLMVVVGTPAGSGSLQTPAGESGLTHVEAYPLTAEASAAHAAGGGQSLAPLDPSRGLTVRTEQPTAVWRIYAAYTTSIASDWGFNGAEHFGVPRISTLAQSTGLTGIEGMNIPSLLAVHTSDGQIGYVRSAQLFGFDPIRGWQSSFDADPITILQEDSVTKVGMVKAVKPNAN